MRKMFFVVSYSCCVAFASAADQSEHYVAMILPDNVILGMTFNAIQTARPEAKILDTSLVAKRPNTVVLTELKKDILPATCYQYHFVDNLLRAVITGILHSGEQDGQMVKYIQEVFAKKLIKQANEPIIRLDDNMQQVSITAELWKDETNGTSVYFADTLKDTTIITFDPRYFTKKDFFVTADQMPDIAPALETVRKQIEESKKLKK